MRKEDLLKKDIYAFFETLIETIDRLGAHQIKLESGEILYKSEIHVMDKIARYPDHNMSELARLMDVTRGMISQVCNKLETKGLLKKEPSSVNKRDIKLVLTADAYEVLKWHDKFHEDMNKDFIEYFSQLEQKEIDTVLNFLDFTKDYMKDLESKRTK